MQVGGICDFSMIKDVVSSMEIEKKSLSLTTHLWLMAVADP